MSYSDRMQKSHMSSFYFAPRGQARLADLGMQIAQQFLSPFDKIIGLIGDSGSGKSMFAKGMFPGLELTNDDSGVNVRPLPILSVGEEPSGFYTPHTYHLDIRFEAAFTQMHELADCILEAVQLNKRVIVEHFELIYPFLNRNADLLLGIGEQLIITRPTIFGPEPREIADIVFKTLPYRLMAHSAEDISAYCLAKDGVRMPFIHADVQRGFILSFQNQVDIDIQRLEAQVNDMIAANIPISFDDDTHIRIGDERWLCSGPRMHVKSTGEIHKVVFNKDLLIEPITGRHLLLGLVGEAGENKHSKKLSDLNKIM